jgi:hypothetical protein
VGSTYYTRLDGTHFLPSGHVGGAWRADEQHFAPVAGLITHALERHAGETGLQISRLSFEILGVIPAAASEVVVDTLRPGRTISLVEATMTVAGRPVVRARAWLLSRQDTSGVAGGAPEPMPPAARLERWDGPATWPGGYIASLEIRRSADAAPGRARAWISTDVQLLADEPVSRLWHGSSGSSTRPTASPPGSRRASGCSPTST